MDPPCVELDVLPTRILPAPVASSLILALCCSLVHLREFFNMLNAFGMSSGGPACCEYCPATALQGAGGCLPC